MFKDIITIEVQSAKKTGHKLKHRLPEPACRQAGSFQELIKPRLTWLGLLQKMLNHDYRKHQQMLNQVQHDVH